MRNRKIIKIFILFIIVGLSFAGCKKEEETVKPEQPKGEIEEVNLSLDGSSWEANNGLFYCFNNMNKQNGFVLINNEEETFGSYNLYTDNDVEKFRNYLDNSSNELIDEFNKEKKNKKSKEIGLIIDINNKSTKYYGLYTRNKIVLIDENGESLELSPSDKTSSDAPEDNQSDNKGKAAKWDNIKFQIPQGYKIELETSTQVIFSASEGNGIFMSKTKGSLNEFKKMYPDGEEIQFSNINAYRYTSQIGEEGYAFERDSNLFCIEGTKDEDIKTLLISIEQ